MNWTEIVKTALNVATSESVLISRNSSQKEMDKAWDKWQEAVRNGWDSSVMTGSKASSELDRFYSAYNAWIDEGF